MCVHIFELLVCLSFLFFSSFFLGGGEEGVRKKKSRISLYFYRSNWCDVPHLGTVKKHQESHDCSVYSLYLQMSV